jgi:hypothetical protein
MFRKAMVGDGSTLTLDFTTGVLDSRLTFTRGSTGTRINASGFVETMSNNVARFDYHPTTGAPQGLLIEAQVANIVTYSGDLTQNGAGHWSGRTNLVTTNWTGFTAPDNTASAVKIIPDTTSGRHTIENNAPSIVNGTTYTASAFVKADGYTVASLVVAGGQARRNFTLTGAGSLGSQFGATNTATIDPVGTQGWYRVTMTWTSTLTGGAAFWIGVPQNATTDVVSSWSGNGTSAIQAWGAQLEAGPGASSYIPTGASQATRNADNCELLDLTTMAFNASAGTIYTDVGTRLNTGSQRNYTFLPASGGNNQIFEGSSSALNVYSSGSFVAQIGTSSPFTAQKIAAAYALNDYAVSVAGGAVATDTSGALPSGLTKLTIGGSIINSAAYMGGCIRVFKYWPTRLTNAQLQSLTT